MRELTGATMVVVGMGNIGRAIARRAVAFDMRVLGVDAYPGDVPAGVETVWGIDRLDAALPEADVVIVATPYTAETHGLIDARRIGLYQTGQLSHRRLARWHHRRGGAAAALHENRLAGAGLDVMAEEPLGADDPLWETPI